jgi:hypothetical protein
MSNIRKQIIKQSQNFSGTYKDLAEGLEKRFISGLISESKTKKLFNLLSEKKLDEYDKELKKVDEKDSKITFINEDYSAYKKDGIGKDIIIIEKKKKVEEVKKIKILRNQELTETIIKKETNEPIQTNTIAMAFYNMKFINAKEASSTEEMAIKAVKNKNYNAENVKRENYKSTNPINTIDNSFMNFMHGVNVENTINIINNSILDYVIKKIKEKKNCKIQLFLKKEFVKQLPDKQKNELILSPNLTRQKHHEVGNQYIIATGISNAEIISSNENTREHIKSLLSKVYNLDIYKSLDSSGYVFNRIDSIGIKIYTIKPITGGSYIETPKKLDNKKCGIINIHNYDDQECFKYCMLYHSSEKLKHDDRLTVLKKMTNKYNFDNIRYPTSIKDIQIFENNNKIKINIYTYEDEKIQVEQLGNAQYIYNDEINLLLLKEDNKAHYIYIKKIEHLIHLSKLTKYKNSNYCPHCRDILKPEEDYKKHVYKFHYNNENNYNIEMPKEGACIQFKNHMNKNFKPYNIYCDFECSINKTNDENKIGTHTPNSIGFYLECYFDPSINKYYSIDGENCAKEFILKSISIYYDCIKHYKKTQEISTTKEEEEKFKNDNLCYICGSEFKKDKNKFFCVETKKYLGAIHNNCSYHLNYKESYIPIILHNSKGYDSHLLLNAIAELKLKEQLTCIPLSNEKFLSFQIGTKLKIIDSCSFLAYSLDSLIEQTILINDDDPYKNFIHMKPYFNNEELKLLCKKNVYPYEYITDIKILEKKGFPPRSVFYSNMKGEVDEKGYLHGEKVYNYFNCKKLYDYHHIYLKVDVLALASIFSNFRNVKKHYGLDPCWYISMSQFSLDAYLYYSKKKIPLMHKLSMLTFAEKMIRGGYTHVGTKRVAEANNKYMLKPLYDENKESNYICSLDINALYPTVMQEYLPDGNYQWLKFKDQEEIYNKIINTDDNAETGYILEGDFYFEESCHDYFREFVPCPQTIEAPYNHFSDYQKEVAKKTEYKANKKKLIASLLPHINYVMHYRMLKFLHSKGVKVIIKKVLSFNQSPFMKDFIIFNHNLRMEAKKEKNSFMEKAYKLISNGLYGKMLQNQRKQQTVILCTNDDEAIKNFSKPEFKTCIYTKSTNGLYIISHNKTKIKMNKPIIIGACVLELSKLLMYNFHYNIIHPNFKKYNIIYGDTDSIYYQIYTEDFYKWMTNEPQCNYFDLSNNPISKQDNKDKLGMMKNDTGDQIIYKFIGIAPKSNGYLTIGPDEDKETKIKEIKIKEVLKSKGTPTDLLKRKTKITDYEDILKTNEKYKLDTYSIRSFNQQLFSTCQTNKIVLNSMYDKMEILDEDNNLCVPFGYKYISRTKEKIFNNIEKLQNINIKRIDKPNILI